MRPFALAVVAAVVAVAAMPHRAVRPWLADPQPAPGWGVPPPESPGLVHALQSGSARPKVLLVFLHGFPDNALVWEPLADSFCGSSLPAPDVRCVALNLPGSAPDDAPPLQAPGFEALAEMLVRSIGALRGMHPGARVILVTHGWGGSIGLLADKARARAAQPLELFDGMVAR